MTLWTEIHRLAHDHPEGPTWPIAEEYVDQCSREQLVALLADAIATMRRHEVRGMEQQAFTPAPPEPLDVEGFEHVTTAVADRPPTRIPRDQFIELLDRSFAVGHHGPRVRWGEATVAQHQERIQMLEKQVSGLHTTIDRHQQAIALIEEEGVRCLDEAIRPVPEVTVP